MLWHFGSYQKLLGNKKLELSPKELRLVKFLNAYPQKVAEAAEGFSPAVIANYAYDTAKEFNQYYHDTGILKEADPGVRSARLLLIRSVAQVLESAMNLLGIELPERM